MNSLCSKFSWCYPECWDVANYDGRSLYVLISLPRNSAEFLNVANNISLPIKMISRIQNPLAYLRFTLQGEYLSHQIGRGTALPQELHEYEVYHPVFSKDADSAMNYNCDKRHYTNPQGNFFINASRIPVKSENVVIVLKKRGNIDQITYTKNHYPMYLLTF